MPEQIKPGSSVRLAFDEFEPMDLPFHLSLGTSSQLHLVATMGSLHLLCWMK